MSLRTLLLVVVAACGGASKPAPATSPAPTAEATETPPASPAADHIAHIDAFLADPTRVDPAPIVTFVSESHDVSVEVNADLMIGLIEEVGLDERAKGLLLVGYIAGSARPQLVNGVKQHDFIAGMRGMVQVYERLQAKVPALDEAAAAEHAGTLEAWAKSWQDKHTAK